MLHDTILALLGIPGDFFLEVKDHSFKISPTLSAHLHPSEITQLNTLASVGARYAYFQKFINKHTRILFSPNILPLSHSISTESGIYLTTFCYGLQEALEPYRQEIQALEHQLLTNDCMTLSCFTLQVDDFTFLFPLLQQLVEQAIEHRSHGVKILEIVFDLQHHGIPFMAQAAKTILSKMSHVLISSVSTCVLYGRINDPFQEFFITSSYNSNKKNDYHVVSHNIPSFISQEFVSKVLFLIKTIDVISMQKSFNNVLYDTATLDGFSKEFEELTKIDGLSVNTFDAIINRIYTYVISKLWENIQNQVNVSTYFMNLKNIYFLGRGDLFLLFFENISSILNNDLLIPENMSDTINNVFLTSYRQLYDDYNTVSEQFILNSVNINQSVISLADLPNYLSISCKIPWPLPVLISDDNVQSYQTIFKHLLQLKIAQFLLTKLWNSLSSCSKANSEHFFVTHVQAWDLRRDLAFCVDNILYYIQVDVLEPMFLSLLNTLNTGSSLISAKDIHSHILDNIQEKLFLKHQMIYSQVENVIEICHKLYSDVSSYMRNPLELDVASAIDDSRMRFNRCFELLFELMCEASKTEPYADIRSLLLRLDYNHYYSLKIGDPKTECFVVEGNNISHV